MKKINATLVLLFISFMIPNFCVSQGTASFDLSYEINKVNPYISIDTKNLKEANTLKDLYADYKSSWIKEYISVEILTVKDGKVKRSKSPNDQLSQEQKDNINTADVNTDILVVVHYLPNNNLKQNDLKKMDFKITVNPDKNAAYPGGQQQLKQYLKENAIDKIPTSVFKQYNLTAVAFTVNINGEIESPSIVESSKDKAIDQLLIETITKMPTWNPAEFTNGVKVKQDFVFTVGDMNSCVVNLLNIRKPE